MTLNEIENGTFYEWCLKYGRKIDRIVFLDPGESIVKTDAMGFLLYVEFGEPDGSWVLKMCDNPKKELSRWNTKYISGIIWE
jgi:hypothetical protein